MKIAITGSKGFLGSHLCSQLEKRGLDYFAIQRDSIEKPFFIKNIDANTEWKETLRNIDVVVHCASIVHDASLIPYSKYDEVNVQGTINLFNQAIEYGVKKFIFISTIKVNGEYTENREKFESSSLPKPEGHYAISKYNTELLLKSISQTTDIELVIIRPPLVYGPNVKANFLYLLKIGRLGLPLPFSKFINKRSLLYVGNLVDLIISCIIKDSFDGLIILPSDGEPISTRRLIKTIYSAFGLRSRLFYMPIKLLYLMALILRKEKQLDRLSQSLIIDHNELNKIGWVPPFRFDEGINLTVDWYLNCR